MSSISSVSSLNFNTPQSLALQQDGLGQAQGSHHHHHHHGGSGGAANSGSSTQGAGSLLDATAPTSATTSASATTPASAATPAGATEQNVGQELATLLAQLTSQTGGNNSISGYLFNAQA
jgi:hypothetical protein